MAVPLHVDDGNFARADQIRDWEYEFPFTGEGDWRSFVARRLMRVASPSLGFSPFMARRLFTGKGYAYMVETTPARAVDGQSRIVEYEEVWASVPFTRRTFQLVSYTAQPAWYSTDGVPTIVEFTDSYQGEVTWEYAIGPLPTLHAPRLEIIGGVLYNRWNWTTNMRNPIADDSEGGIYMGGIYYRKTLRVALPSYSVVVIP
jgi:hypothetical protein